MIDGHVMGSIALWAGPGITILMFGLAWRQIQQNKEEVGKKYMRRDVCNEIGKRRETERRELKEDIGEIKGDVKKLLRMNGGERR